MHRQVGPYQIVRYYICQKPRQLLWLHMHELKLYQIMSRISDVNECCLCMTLTCSTPVMTEICTACEQLTVDDQ